MGLRGKSENQSFLECRISRIAEKLSIYAARGKTVWHSVKKRQVLGSFRWTKVLYQNNVCDGKKSGFGKRVAVFFMMAEKAD